MCGVLIDLWRGAAQAGNEGEQKVGGNVGRLWIEGKEELSSVLRAVQMPGTVMLSVLVLFLDVS